MQNGRLGSWSRKMASREFSSANSVGCDGILREIFRTRVQRPEFNGGRLERKEEKACRSGSPRFSFHYDIFTNLHSLPPSPTSSCRFSLPPYFPPLNLFTAQSRSGPSLPRLFTAKVFLRFCERELAASSTSGRQKGRGRRQRAASPCSSPPAPPLAIEAIVPLSARCSFPSLPFPSIPPPLSSSLGGVIAIAHLFARSATIFASSEPTVRRSSARARPLTDRPTEPATVPPP